MSDDYLRAQLSQAQDAFAAAERLRQAAEAEYRAAADKLRQVAQTLLPAEWNTLRRDQPDAATWPPDRLGTWIVEAGRRKLNRLELLVGGDLGLEELEALTAERDGLREQSQRTRDALATLRAEHESVLEQVAARDAELARLREEVVALRETRAPSPSVSAGIAVVADWLAADEQSQDALRVLGMRGFCLRAGVANAIGFKDATSGAARRVFNDLRERGLLEEERPQAETVGRTPYLLRLTERGRETFRALFGQEPVEPEYDRLLARHKSPEHVLLNLQARDALLAGGAESVDLYPRPVPLPNGGTFDVDLVAVFEGRPLYVEAERGVGKKRTRKWDNYATVTKDFYVVVPNKKAKSAIISELDGWAYHNLDQATGVTLRVCQLSGFDGETLWQTVKVLGRRRGG